MFILEAKYTTNLPQVAYSAQQVQQYEAQAAQNSGTQLSHLMQRAGEALFSWFEYDQVSAQHVLLLVGKGNNAGDAYVLAKLLHQSGRNVCVFSLYDPALLSGDAKDAYHEACKHSITVVMERPKISDFCVIVDGVFGTGFRGDLSNDIQALFKECANTRAKCLSIDVPSGINGTTGIVAKGAFCADVTITFIALKQGLLTGTAKGFCGQLLYASLAVEDAFYQLTPPSAVYMDHTALFVELEKRPLDSYKNTCGHVLLVGGNKGMAGAIRLASEAALRSGAGLVTVATHPDNVASVLQGRYELMVHGIQNASELSILMSKADIMVIGPGLGQDEWAQAIFTSSLGFAKPVVCDADGLNLLAKTKLRFDNAILTPHFAEAKRLACDFETIDVFNRFELASHLAKTYKATLVLKGPGTLTVSEECININRSGCAAMASAGMGDVLSGIIGALLAQGMKPFAATSLAVYIHGLAAQIAAKEGERGLLASDLFVHIRRLLG
ncbi:Bifunctional NAD(P)H-hydrate repair enzyme Nnr [Pseudoalteromonas sp. CIP111854]|uniref:Bifunctional NAD(P)H-hydrate repair enzyme n=1 Tax=Pseudoalteromonas holothuriae TaxID=2963714 RepID=A0A9W4VM99_9GAMM|nr:NAD(P)H-hydrate dehydratase [Pseudoalteromonas sp. CIP111854]CAH9049645.1 Bifunctional NAD(P)H-hydrate repair enzyme Nnr [Pseudoalteromonas sp. CIP111854]